MFIIIGVTNTCQIGVGMSLAHQARAISCKQPLHIKKGIYKCPLNALRRQW